MLLLPSRYEGPSYVPLEGAARGIPTIAFDLPCFSDRREFMYLARAFDTAAFATEIERAFHDSRLYDEKRGAAATAVQSSPRVHPPDAFRDFVASVLERHSRRL